MSCANHFMQTAKQNALLTVVV